MSELTQILRKKEISSILLVTDSFLKSSGATAWLEDIPVMAKHAHKEANPLYPVPVLMNAGELEQFYYNVADWSGRI